MRRPFAHDAVVVLDSGDIGALGAAITVELCGHWEHEPPCPLAPHHTDAAHFGDEVRVRVLFAADPADEALVRGKIETALSRWQIRSSQPGVLRPDETAHAARLATG